MLTPQVCMVNFTTRSPAEVRFITIMPPITAFKNLHARKLKFDSYRRVSS